VKNMRLFSVFLLGSTIVFTSQVNANNMNGFQCSFPISKGQQSIRKFTMISEVYRCLKYSDHKDLVIVNSEHQIVPFHISTPSQAVDVSIYKQEISFYQEPAASTYKTGDQIRRIAQLTGVASGSESDVQWVNKNSYYSSVIIEQNKTKGRLKSIIINYRTGADPVSSTVVVEASSDLQNWSTLLSPQNIFYLPGKHNNMQSNDLKFSSSSDEKYLRLAFLSNIDDFNTNIIGITGEYEVTKYIDSPMQWFNADSLRSLDEQGEWSMSLSDIRPVSRIRFTPASDIAYYQGSIFIKRYLDPVIDSDQHKTREDAKKKIKHLIKDAVQYPHAQSVSPWQHISIFAQYKIQTDNGSIKSSDIQLTPIQSKTWKFVFNQPRMADVSQLPGIEFGWQSPQVIFIAQGAGPFFLLAGNAELPQKAVFPSHLVAMDENLEVVDLLPEEKNNDINVLASSDETIDMKYDLKTILLWLTLFFGVGLMALMASQLARKIKSENK